MSNNDTKLSGPLKRAVLFHDLSGFGKCSITSGLPILSAAGIEGCCVPTAVLSTHTGGFKNFTFRDLTDDLPAFLNHWNDLDIHFDSIYSGYLGSPRQVEILLDFIHKQKEKNDDLLVFIDPVMGDNGELYPSLPDSLVDEMKKLVSQADIILPNITEATKLLDKEYVEGPYEDDYVEELARELRKLGPETIIITGIEQKDGRLGIGILEDDTFDMIQADRVPGDYHGTGDIFSGFTLAGLMNEKPLKEAVQMAADLTGGAAARTYERETPRRDGVDFEGMLPQMMKTLELV